MNRENESLQENARVQECLALVKQERKPIVRYIQVRGGTPWIVSAPNDIRANTQLVENEDMIGTLIETNERIIAALEMYDMAVSFKIHSLPFLLHLTKLPTHQLSKPVGTQEDVDKVQKGLVATTIEDSELTRLQEKQRAAVGRAVRGGGVRESGGQQVHPDLQDLNFGELEEKRCANLSSAFSLVVEREEKQQSPTSAQTKRSSHVFR